MPYITSEYCIGCQSKSCVAACPVNCMYVAHLVVRLPGLGIVWAGEDELRDRRGMVMINPDECTSCGACETECPVEAIYEDSSVPEELQEWIAINARYTRSLTSEQKEKRRQFAE